MDDFETWGVYYDAIYREKIEEMDDAEFYRSLLEECGDPALEIACGTGRLYLDFLADGYAVDGVDISKQMLDRLQEKATERDLTPTVYHGDAAELNFMQDDYRLVYLPFSAILHFNTVDHRKRLFANVYDHLEDGGAFAFDVFVTDFDTVANEYGSINVDDIEVDGETYRYETWSELKSRLEQTAVMHNRIIDPETRKIEWETEFHLSLFPKQQIELHLELAGFSEWRFEDLYVGGEADGETEQLACVAKR